MQQVVIRLLGPPEIRCRDELIKIPRRRSRALLFYMVCTHTAQPRERLLALLCDEMDEVSARHTFKTLLAEVRARLRSIDPSIEWISGDGDLLTLNPLAPLWLDTEVFETTATSSLRNLVQAVKLYRGPFLDGFFLRDSPDFDAWMRSTRDHFHQLYLSALRRMGAMQEAEGQLAQAIACAQMLVQADPLSEEAHTSLMRLYWQQGDRVEALRQYEKLCTQLAQELTIKPMASTVALYEQIAHTSWSVPLPAAPPAVPPAPSSQPTPARSPHKPQPEVYPPAQSRTAHTPFSGRDRELNWLRDALLGPKNNAPLLLISGESGSGKTRLLEESMALHCASWRVFHGACQEVEQSHPYHAIIEALRRGLTAEDVAHLQLPGIWQAALASLLPDIIQSNTLPPAHPTLATLLADALVALFHQLASLHGLLALVIDDLHWADAATLALLGHLVRHVRPHQTFFLCTWRSNMQDMTLHLKALREGARRQGALAELALPLLSLHEITLLTRSFLAAHPALSPRDEAGEAVLSDWCYRQSEGNPALALEALRLATEVRAQGQDLPEYALSAPMNLLLESFLHSLSQQAIRVLAAASILGYSFDFSQAASMAGLDHSASLLALQELSRQSMIVEATPLSVGYYTFAHRLLREHLLATLSAAQRAILLSHPAIVASDTLL